MNDEYKKSRILDIFLILGYLVVGGIVAFLIFQGIKDRGGVSEELQFSVDVCSKVSGTPSWASENGTIVGVGYLPFGNESLKVVNEYLIPNKIYFVYSSGCGYCALQVKDFGETWSKYVESGFTINCVEVFEKVKSNEETA